MDHFIGFVSGCATGIVSVLLPGMLLYRLLYRFVIKK